MKAAVRAASALHSDSKRRLLQQRTNSPIYFLAPSEGHHMEVDKTGFASNTQSNIYDKVINAKRLNKYFCKKAQAKFSSSYLLMISPFMIFIS